MGTVSIRNRVPFLYSNARSGRKSRRVTRHMMRIASQRCEGEKMQQSSMPSSTMMSGPNAMRIMWRVTRRDFRPDRALLYRKGTRFRIETVPILPLQADGELLGVTPAEITVEPLAAHLLVPGR